MAFTWKDNGKIFVGEGIYYLTFVVAGRRPLLGELVAEYPDDSNLTVERSADINATSGNMNAIEADWEFSVKEKAKMARVVFTPFGKAVDDDLRHFQDKHPGMMICARKIMPDHIHVVIWVKENGKQSIRQVGHGFRIGITHIAKGMGIWPPVAQAHNTNDPKAEKVVDIDNDTCHVSSAGLILDQPFIRTLSRSGQLRSMIDYVVLNPYRKYMRRQHPELFTMHKDTEVKGLRFRSMGNHWLLDWPERQIVQCSRSISEEDLQRQMKQTLEHAERGAITYTAAISKGEQTIARAVREAGWPLVVLLLDGFPPEGSESERYYKPGGVYFDACNNGKLLLLEAYNETYDNPLLIERTEVAIKAKDEAKGYDYRPLPHDSKRWRMIAGNVMLEMVGED